MQFPMRTFFATLLLGMAGAASCMLSTAWADMVMRPPPHFERDLRHRAAAAALRTSDVSDPDTVWIGHVNTVTGLPGTPGGYGPYHIGRGPNRIVGGLQGTPANYNGVWSFDHFNAGETDSLMGWWSIQCPFGSVGPTNFDDVLRPWFGLDYGNQGNYVIPQGSPKRTFGVVGYWHADGGSTQPPLPADPSHNPAPLTWAPISGTRSAWCGLRSHGDVAVVDPTTGNGINSTVLQFQGDNSGGQLGSNRPQGTDHNFPGYGSQWDQMLYRDIDFGTSNVASNVTIQFSYRTDMSTGFQAGHSSQTGYFYKDPVKAAASGDGNFISMAAAALTQTQPRDSFMVFIGAPVNDAAAQLSDGTVAAVYDPQRRWFSEVVKINTPGTSYKRILGVSGINPTTTFNQSFTPAEINAILDADGGSGNGGRVRLVFRVKTNRGFDDENNGVHGFSSGTAGAAIIDDVAVSGPVSFSNGFDAPGDINNSVGVPATAAWKSTGKPPGAWFHVHNLSELPFDDPCGAVTAPVRFCNMGNGVLSPGNHDLADKPGGIYGTNTQDQQKYAVSPAINLVSTGPGAYNGMGIDSEIASRVLILVGDQMNNLYEFPATGNGFRFCWQSYPATQPNGVKTWGELRKTIFFFFTEVAGCFEGLMSKPADDQLIVTSNTNGIPDSIRVYIESMSRCYSTNVSSTACSPSSGVKAGGYFDNLSIGFAKAPPPAALSAVIWDLFNDCFPVNATNQPASFGPHSDTLAAKIKSGFNLGPATGDPPGALDAREVIPGDSAFVGAPGSNVRLDLVFRILPGVGNYVQIGNRVSGIRRVPTATTQAVDNAASTNFWESYMGDNGAFGTGGNGTSGLGHPGTNTWDPNTWNSARMDTVEINMFPMGFLAELGKPVASQYATSYHESDLKYGTLGIVKNRCFYNNLADVGKSFNQDRINCGIYTPLGFTTYPPAWTSGAGTGFDPNEISGQPGRTREYTKILPDGQFTPGAHIQYFFRRSLTTAPLAGQLAPDTNFIFPQDAEGGYFDFHRWREISVLPDRWKDPAFAAGGLGMACMLVLDLADRRGDEAIWVAVADSIGLTGAAKRGAHNGWRARPDQNFVGVNVGGDDSICRRDNGGQAGTHWDLYETVAGESNVMSGRPGSRGASKNLSTGSLTIGRHSTHGPSEPMVLNYKLMVLLASDIQSEVLGPLMDQTDADVNLITSFLTLPGGAGQPRGFIGMGQGLGKGLADVDLGHPAFLIGTLRASLRVPDYRLFSGNTNDVADLITVPPVGAGSGFTYGVANQCFLSLDVFNVETPAPAGQAGTFYENVGGSGPYVAAVYSPETGTKNYRTLINGWTFGLFGGMGAETNLATVGTRKYMQELLTNAFGTLSCGVQSTPVSVGDDPGRGSFVNFMSLKSSNPMRTGEARIAFGVTKTEKVEVKIYDVSGRAVKTVANRVFAGGQEHVVIWDGTSDAGERVKSGVYFYQLRTPSWVSQKKLAVLGN